MSINEYIGAEDLSPPALKALGRIKQVGELTDYDLSASEDLVRAIFEGLSDEDRRAVAKVVRRHAELLMRQARVCMTEECFPNDLKPSDFE